MCDQAIYVTETASGSWTSTLGPAPGRVVNGPLDGIDLDALVARARQLEVTNRARRDTTRDWCSIAVNADESSATVRIYDEIGFWGTTAASFAEQLDELDVDRIDLRIKSPGGSVFDGVAIYNVLRDHRAHVDVTVDAIAASAASFIAQAGDTITMGRQAMMMIHNASGVTVGDSGAHREMADLLDKINLAIAAIYADRSGVPQAEWLDAMAATTWYSAAEAVDAKLADTTADGDDDDQEDDESVEEAAARFADTLRAYGVDPSTLIAGEPVRLPVPDGEPADGDDADAERVKPAATAGAPDHAAGSGTVGVDLAAAFRAAVEAEVAPPPFALDGDTVRGVIHHRHRNAPAPTSFPKTSTDDPEPPLNLGRAILEEALR